MKYFKLASLCCKLISIWGSFILLQSALSHCLTIHFLMHRYLYRYNSLPVWMDWLLKIIVAILAMIAELSWLIFTVIKTLVKPVTITDLDLCIFWTYCKGSIIAPPPVLKDTTHYKFALVVWYCNTFPFLLTSLWNQDSKIPVVP